MDSVSLQRGEQSQWRLAGHVVFGSVSDLLKTAPDELFSDSQGVIDLANVERMDSAGLALLLEWLREARRQGGSLRFTNIPESIMSYARVCGLEGLLTH